MRALWRAPRFTLPAIAALTLGIGASTAVFSVVDSVLLRPLPYRDPDRIAVILESSPARSSGDFPLPGGDFEDIRNQNTTFESMSAAESWSPVLAGMDRTEQLKGLRVSSNLFETLGVPTVLGRGFSPGDEAESAPPVVVLSYSLWQRRFGGSRDVIGRTIRLNEGQASVIGVLPEHFYFPPFWAAKAEIYTAPAYRADRKIDRVIGTLRGFGRLKSGVSIGQARADLRTISARIAAAHPRTNEGVVASVTPIQEKTAGSIQTLLIVLLAAVSFTLLIGCANVASMLIARAVGRRKEIAIRESLGAGRLRIMRQMLTESLLLAGAAGIAGFLLAAWAVPVAVSAIPDSGVFQMPRRQDIGIHAGVLLFNVVASFTAALLFGLAPALSAGRTDLNRDLRESSRGATASRGAPRIRTILVAVEVAVALALLSGAGLLIRTFQNLRSVDPGFDAHNVLAVNLAMSASSHAAAERRAQFYYEALEGLRSLPGVKSASAVNHVPLAGDIFRQRVTVEGRPAPAPAEAPSAVYRVAMPGYFRTMGMTLRSGRDFDERDREGAPRVAVVNAAMASQLWPGENPIGKRFRPGDPQSNGPWLTIVGVLNNVKQWNWDQQPDSEFYIPFRQDETYFQSSASFATMTLVVKATRSAAAIAPAIEQQIQAVDRDVAIPAIVPMEQVIAEAIWKQRASMTLMTGFAVTAAMLAAFGILGVVSFAVAARSQEIGIRIALGARRAEIVRMVLVEAMRPVLAGAAAGCVTAIALSRLLNSLLYGVRPQDPLAPAAAAGTIIVLSALAILAPARRAAAADPMVVLRAE